MFNEKLNSRFK